MFRPPQTFRDNLRPPPGRNHLQWYGLTLRKFTETGFAITNIAKSFLIVVGIALNNVENATIMFVSYIVFSTWLGYVWHLWGFVEIENELSNRFNLFTREMRDMRKQIEK